MSDDYYCDHSDLDDVNETKNSGRVLVLDKKDDSDDEEQEVRERDTWTNKYSYLLTLIGYAVGFGNLWRFPYRLQTYGGG